MNLQEWTQSNNAYEMLQYMKEIDEAKFSRNADKIQLYFLRCSNKFLKYRSNETTKNGLDASKRHLKNLVSDKEFHQQEWLIEGMAFGVDTGLERDYPNPYSVDFDKSKDLKMVRVNRGLYGKYAKQYLMDLAYFIDNSMAYSRDSKGELPSIEYANFLSSNILRRMFNYWYSK